MVSAVTHTHGREALERINIQSLSGTFLRANSILSLLLNLLAQGRSAALSGGSEWVKWTGKPGAETSWSKGYFSWSNWAVPVWQAAAFRSMARSSASPLLGLRSDSLDLLWHTHTEMPDNILWDWESFWWWYVLGLDEHGERAVTV